MESLLQKDAYLVFRALCKLSIRSSDNSAGTDLTVLRGKVGHPQDSTSDMQTSKANQVVSAYIILQLNTAVHAARAVLRHELNLISQVVACAETAGCKQASKLNLDKKRV